MYFYVGFAWCFGVVPQITMDLQRKGLVFFVSFILFVYVLYVYFCLMFVVVFVFVVLCFVIIF